MQAIRGLDGLRFLAVFAVIFTHLDSFTWAEQLGLAKQHILISGWTGVVLFYVISGFLITSLAMHELASTGRFSIRQFFIRRSLRIFPLYFGALLAYVAAHCLALVVMDRPLLKWPSFGYALTYTYNFISKADYQGWLGSFHTLATEEHFYLFFPVLVLIFARSRLAFLLAVLACIFLIPLTRPFFAAYETAYFVDRWTPYACIPIFIGCLAALVNGSPRFQALCSRRGAFAMATLLALFFVGYGYQLHRQDATMLGFGFSALVLAISRFQQSRLVHVLSLRIPSYLGRISYGLYVWQSFFLSTGNSERIIPPKLLAFVVVIAVSIASYELFEKRLLALKARFRPVGNPHP